MTRRLFTLALLLLACSSLVAQQFDPALYGEMRWRMIGPHRGGRTVSISGVPGKQNVFYIGVNNGGVWRSIDFGQTWESIFDDQPTQSIGALAVAHSNPDIIYVGSGEGLQRPDLSVGDGIYKTTDGGRTWQHLGLRDGQQIPVILVDPRDPNRVYVAVLGHPYGPNPERGVFRSSDGGQNWQKVLYKDEDTGAVDLVMDPKDPRTLYAVLWAARQAPWENGQWQGLLSGLYKSTDGGDTWKQVGKGLPTPAQGLGRIGLGIAPSDGRRLYANVEAPQSRPSAEGGGGIYRSDDGGENWRRVNMENRIYGRGSDFAEVRVDPRNPDVVYVCNTSTYKSTDGGENFTAIKGAPGGDDYHRVWINPENPDILAIASDQGATISVNGGKTWSSWYNQPTAQFYHVVTDNQFPYWVYGGQQESGSIAIASRSDYGAITFRDWHPVGVEEYGYVAPDPNDPHIIYGGKASRYDDRTHQTQDISPAGTRRGQSYRFLRTAPIMFSPTDSHLLYLAGNVLFKTINGGHSWEIISPDLSRPKPTIPPSFSVFERGGGHVEQRGVIYALAPSPKDGNLIWAGTDDGLIHVTRDGGKTWQNVTPPDLTDWSKVSQLAASHSDPQTCYAAINRIRVDDLKPHIYATHDGGKSWQAITTGLPDNEPVNTVKEDPERRGLLFAGTERSVYVSFDDGARWQPLRMNLPASSVRDLVVHGDDIVVGTHGRSFWILDDITPLRQMPEMAASQAALAQTKSYLFKPQHAVRFRRSTNPDTPLPPEVPAGKNPPDGAVINYVVGPGSTGPVTLEILDRSHAVVRRYSSEDKPQPTNPRSINVPMYWVREEPTLSAAPGMHRWIWDLHYAPLATDEKDFPISAIPHDTPAAPEGPRALPGEYDVRLTVGGRTMTWPLEVAMDPRVATPPEGLRQQFDLETKIAGLLERANPALHELRALRGELAARRAVQKSLMPDLLNQIADLEKKAAQLEGAGNRFGPPPAAPAGATPGIARITATLLSVYSAIDGADAPPTVQSVAALNDAAAMLDPQLNAWNAVKTKDIPALNSSLRSNGLPEITLKGGALE